MPEFPRNGPKKAWKALQADFDYVFEQSDRTCCYALSTQEIAALLSMTDYLRWPSRWISSAGDIDIDLITSFTDRLERRLMAGCCDDNMPIQFQYSPDGVLQMSMNGGSIFTDAPQFDPRVYSPTFPPLAGADGEDKRCIAATGAAALIQEQIAANLTDEMSRYTLTELIKDWVSTYLESSNPFQSLLTVAANQIFALIIAVLRPALTETVFEQLKCILYCNSGDDATVTDAQLDQITTDIGDQIGGIATLFLQQLINLLGTKGVTNLLRAGAATSGDCSDCSDCSDGCDLTKWSVYHGTEISRGTDFIIVEATAASDYGGQACGLIADTGFCCFLASVQAVGTTTDYSGPNVHSNCDETPVAYPSIQHNTIGTISCSQEMNMLMLYGALGSTQFKFTFSPVSC